MTAITRREFLASITLAAAGAALGLRPDESRPDILNYGTVYRHGHPYTRSGKFSHSEPSWKELRNGLYFTRLTAYRGGQPVDSMGIVKANPEYSRFRVFHDISSDTIEGWQSRTNAEVVFNSSYYQVDRNPAGLIITNGRMKGPKVNKAMKGMFVAEPAGDRRPRATIIDLTEQLFDYTNPVWKEGVQSFPMLLDSRGRIGIKNSGWHANRTVVCNDHDDSILALTTEGGYFSLHDMGLFLRESALNIRNALNMDGGYEADMMVKTPKLTYLTYGQWETQSERDISIPGVHILIPAVVGIFPRNQ